MASSTAQALAPAEPSTARARRSSGSDYQPALDGVRAVAIAGVLALHSNIWGDVPSLMPGGNLGVSVFFVLSGYLITTRLLREHGRSGAIDLRAFYVRRAARLLPPLLVLLPIYAVLFSGAVPTGQLLLTVAATLLYLSSIVQSIWGAMGNLGWSWSLSVEEYFYALWPVLLRRLLSRSPATPSRWRPAAIRDPLLWAIALALGAAVLASALRIVLSGSPYWNDFVYYSPLTRIDALALGCLIALVQRRSPRALRLPPGVGWLALAGLAWSYAQQRFAIGGAPLDRYGLTLSAALAALLIVAVVRRPRSPLARLLSSRPLAHVGRVSYGLYVWNLLPGQTFHLLALRHPGLTGTLVCAAIVIVVVELSYWFVERPCMRWARRRLADERKRPSRKLSWRGLRRRRPLGAISSRFPAPL